MKTKNNNNNKKIKSKMSRLRIIKFFWKTLQQHNYTDHLHSTQLNQCCLFYFMFILNKTKTSSFCFFCFVLFYYILFIDQTSVTGPINTEIILSKILLYLSPCLCWCNLRYSRIECLLFYLKKNIILAKLSQSMSKFIYFIWKKKKIYEHVLETRMNKQTLV